MKWFLFVIFAFSQIGTQVWAQDPVDEHKDRHPGFLDIHPAIKRPPASKRPSNVIPLEIKKGTAVRQEDGTSYTPSVRVLSQTQSPKHRQVTLEVNHENPCAKDRVTPYVKREGSVFYVEILNQKLPTETQRCINPLYKRTYTFSLSAEANSKVLFKNPTQ